MKKYEIRYGKMDTEGIFPYLGEIIYPYELRKGDVVVISENMVNVLREKFPELTRNQFWVSSILYFLSPSQGNEVIPPTVYITEDPE